MSLVGNLQDLGLDEIFQIAGISGKTGVLHLHNGDIGIRILFDGGQIQAAFDDRSGVLSDLGDLALDRGLLEAGALSQLRDAIEASGGTLGEGLIELGYLDADGLQNLLRSRVETLVSEVFRWERGEFSFDLGELRPDGAERDFVLKQGLNPQFVALEAARMLDEQSVGGSSDAPLEGSESSEEFLATFDADADVLLGSSQSDAPEPPAGAGATEAAETPDDTPAERAKPPEPLPVVAVDSDLATLEWVKEALAPTDTRIHILQRSEQAVARVRQYVLRGEAAIALLTDTTPPDPVSGAADWIALTARLRAQVPKQRVLFLGPADGIPQDLETRARPDAFSRRPNPTELSDPRAEPERQALAEKLRQALAEMQGLSSATGGDGADPWRARWEGVRDHLRHAPSAGAVWDGLLDFAAQGFERTALFTIQEEEATGVGARVRREAGADAEACDTTCTLSVEDSAWLRKVLETRSALRAGPESDGDRAIFAELGEESPDEAYVAPIERCGTLVAILYGDNAIRRGTVPDTRPLEPVLKEAGLALERFPAHS